MQRGKKQLKSIAVVALLGLLLGGCGQVAEQSAEGELRGTLTVSGDWTLYPMMVRWGEEFHALHPDVQFDISAGGAGKGIADALAGAVDIGMVSREIYQEEIEQGAFWVAVTMDAVVPTVNADNPYLARLQAQGMTRATFEAIWMGQITTWGEAIGDPAANDEIHVYTRSDACGAAATGAAYLGDYGQEDLLGVRSTAAFRARVWLSGFVHWRRRRLTAWQRESILCRTKGKSGKSIASLSSVGLESVILPQNEVIGHSS